MCLSTRIFCLMLMSFLCLSVCLPLRIIEDCPLATLRATTDGQANPHVQNLVMSITRPLYMECTYVYTHHVAWQSTRLECGRVSWVRIPPSAVPENDRLPWVYIFALPFFSYLCYRHVMPTLPVQLMRPGI